jgi:thiamine pyrophosphate-dependent acetolactate synthase large subunit-like protein
VDTLFYLMGGPMIDCQQACVDEGMLMIDVRHEQAAGFMATAWSRMLRRPSVCMAASGPGVANLVSGVAHAWADGAPVIAIGGASPLAQNNTLAFQEVDQLAMFRPITRWADRCYSTMRIPEYVDMAFRMAYGSRPGPVYLDVPADVLFGEVPEDGVAWTEPAGPRPRPFGDPAAIAEAIRVLEAASSPVLIYGSGVLWGEAEASLLAFVDRFEIPFFATPQGRGAIPEDHPLSLLAARSAAFRGCDVIVEIATRQNYVIDQARGSRWNAGAKLIQIDIDASEIGRNRRADVPIVGDVRSVLDQLVEAGGAHEGSDRYSSWILALRTEHDEKAAAAEVRASSDGRPMHPLRLCKEVRDVLPRDAVLVVDGQEILTYARQFIPFYAPRSLNSGTFGTMGVGLPLGIGAKLALPDAPVLVLHGDGSFGINAMEMDTAVRLNIPIVCVISNNAGWAGVKTYPGSVLGHTRYDLMFEPLGAHTEHVEDPDRVGGAITDAFASGRPSVINVVTDPDARATSVAFAQYAT